MDISLTWERRSEMIHEALWFLSTGFLEGQGNTSRLLLILSMVVSVGSPKEIHGFNFKGIWRGSS